MCCEKCRALDGTSKRLFLGLNSSVGSNFFLPTLRTDWILCDSETDTQNKILKFHVPSGAIM